MTDGITKFLWVVSVHDVSPKEILQHVRASKAQAVCIRTSNHDLPATIALFRSKGIKVFGWRWPAVARVSNGAPHYYALDEARYVAETLIPAGLEGYIVDPESDSPGRADDWNHASLAPLAREFCQIVRGGAAAFGCPDFRFGVTSGANYPSRDGKPNIPWAEFVESSDAVYPQSYWRWRRPTDARAENIHGGKPDAATLLGQNVWSSVCTGKPIIPIAGELDVITASEITRFGKEMLKTGNELHFYADTDRVPDANYRAIARICLPPIIAKGRPEPPANPIDPPPHSYEHGPKPEADLLPAPRSEKEVEPHMRYRHSELPLDDFRPVARLRPNLLARAIGWMRGLSWVSVTLMSVLLAAQAVWPDLSNIEPNTVGPIVRKFLEIVIDRPAELRQSSNIGDTVPTPGFLGYIYYNDGAANCGGVRASGASILALPCDHKTAPNGVGYQFGQIVRVSGDVEVREHPWENSALVAMVQTGQCVEVVGMTVRQVEQGTPHFPGLWMPVRRATCPTTV
jgi:hypothetical protein